MSWLTTLLSAVALLIGGGSGQGDEPIHVDPPKPGALYGSVHVPRLHVTAPIREGARLRELNVGAGHLPSTYWPGMGGTVAFFGHRKTPMLGLHHGIFRHIDRLRRGDRIVIKMPYGRYVYEVTRHEIVRPTAWSSFKAELGHEELLIAACSDRHGGTSYWNNPKAHTVFRYVVTARLDAPGFVQQTPTN